MTNPHLETQYSQCQSFNHFFMNNKPAIWYRTSNKGELEFFNSRDIHSATGKKLKPITAYIINKYVYAKD